MDGANLHFGYSDILCWFIHYGGCGQIQGCFNIIQSQLSLQKLVVNADKTKVLQFSNARKKPVKLDIITAQRKKL